MSWDIMVSLGPSATLEALPAYSEPTALMINDLIPEIIAEVEAHKEDILGLAGGFVVRKALELSWSSLMYILPLILKMGYRATIKTFGAMTINDLLQRLAGDFANVQKIPSAY